MGMHRVRLIVAVMVLVAAVLSGCGSAAVTVVSAALLGWLFIEAQGGGALGLAERLTTSAQACWPFVVALALRRGTSWLDGKTGGSKTNQLWHNEGDWQFRDVTKASGTEVGTMIRPG